MPNKRVRFKKTGGSFQHEWLNIYKWLNMMQQQRECFAQFVKHMEKIINLQEKVANKYN